MFIKAILCDLDGTLVDSNEQHITVWDEVFRAEGVTVNREAIHSQIGKGADMLVPALLPHTDAAVVERLANAHGVRFKERYLGRIRPFLGARDFLLTARDAGQVVVWASSASASDLNHYLDLLEARDLVSATTSADEVEHSKPAPDIFAAALAKVAPITPDQVIAIGDTPYDVIAAAQCGIATIALRSGGFSDEALRAAGAVGVYDDIAALHANYADSLLGHRG
ncbi:HAD family hydrolase [Sphingomonas sp. CFBP 13720]|jgi:beta-phosphoglucomutase-like phosphatase (HAD superfamily)|uniref:HAD family hydrolase n=1 Tax=Sphingomonas sp. CFBP 13720 TaxID=2775302 RepID=UPI00177D5427|nr:HAD family hydrolase [Sphingomonas sp. CFBP 13720]MBD8680069.1 HAD family hydrolase [Sphingomonas sp. CFBP 13720]